MTLPFDAAVMAERNRDIVYEAVITAIERAAAEQGVTKSEIARRLGMKAPQISRWLSGPSNWTLNTVSHLLFAVGATMDYEVIFDSERQPTRVETIFSSLATQSLPSQAATGSSAVLTVEVRA